MNQTQVYGQIRGGDFNLCDLSVEYLNKTFLPGICVEGVGREFYEEHLQNASEFVAHETGVSLFDEEIRDEPHDYIAGDFMQYSFIRLNRQPIKSVQRIEAMYPTGNYIFTFPTEWIRIDKNGGQINIVPSGGSLSQALLGQGGTYLPIIYRNLQFLPQLFHCYYIAGWDNGKVPRRLVEAVCKKACIDILAVLGDIIYGPGIVSRSLSVDGLSQSESFVNNGQDAAIFTSRIARYQKDLWGDPQTRPDQDGLLQSIKKEYRGLSLTSL